MGFSLYDSFGNVRSKFDPDGHMVEIGESMALFVKRLSLLMSPTEVSSKTGLSIKQIEQVIG